MSSNPVLCVALAAILATQPACVATIQERCPLVTEARAPPALPPDFAQLDGLLYQRAAQMMRDVQRLRGSATTSFHIWFANDTLPLWCGRMEQARALAAAGQRAAAGRKYQALLVFSQLMELAIAVHSVVEYADAVKEPSLVLVQTVETFGNQVELILAAALSEDPREIERALTRNRAVFTEWRQYLERWVVHIRADAERMKVAKGVWDVTIGVIAAYEAAGSLAKLATSGRPPMSPVPALATAGGGALAVGAGPVVSLELAEAIRTLIASGALDAGVVAAVAATSGGGGEGEVPGSLKGDQLREYLRQAQQYGSGGVKVLENGRIRFYGQLRPARAPGEMAGARVVREWDPITGSKRTWIETLDQRGAVRSVRPEAGESKVHHVFDAEGNYVGPR